MQYGINWNGKLISPNQPNDDSIQPLTYGERPLVLLPHYTSKMYLMLQSLCFFPPHIHTRNTAVAVCCLGGLDDSDVSSTSVMPGSTHAPFSSFFLAQSLFYGERCRIPRSRLSPSHRGPHGLRLIRLSLCILSLLSRSLYPLPLSLVCYLSLSLTRIRGSLLY